MPVKQSIPQALRDKLKRVPGQPGVYLHKNRNNQILYVGKAKNLNHRIKSYFMSVKNHSAKTLSLVEKIEDFDYILVDNEAESLILENNLIKLHKPPYNILLRDDKTYPYFKLTLQDPWPKLEITKRRKNDGALYFGPYPQRERFYALYKTMNTHFPLIKCTPTQFKHAKRPCHYYEINQCLGPCTLPVPKEQYLQVVQTVTRLLQGKIKEVKAHLTQEMLMWSSRLEFERAAQIRNQIQALDDLGTGQSVSLHPSLQADIWAATTSEITPSKIPATDSIPASKNSVLLSVYMARIRDGQLLHGQDFVWEQWEHDKSTADYLTALVGQYYQRHPAAPLVIFHPNTDLGDFKETLDAVFSQLKNKAALWVGKPKGLKKELAQGLAGVWEICLKNAQNKLLEQREILTKNAQMSLAFQTFLKLPKIPHWVECFDISTWQGQATVASRAVFKAGAPFKDGYRRYAIQGVKTDDFASLKEIMGRRYKGDDPIPDVMIIDGGEPQVREVAKALKALAMDHVFFVGLAKARTRRNFSQSAVESSKERVVFPCRNGDGSLNPAGPVHTEPLVEGSGAFRFFTQIRDEAHRFAVSYHRLKRDKELI